MGLTNQDGIDIWINSMFDDSGMLKATKATKKLSEDVTKKLSPAINTISDAIQNSMVGRKGWASGFDRAEKDINKGIDNIVSKANNVISKIDSTKLGQLFRSAGKPIDISKTQISQQKYFDSIYLPQHNAKKAFDKIMNDLEISQQETLFKRVQKTNKKIAAEIAKGPATIPFAGWAMSLMFLGMAMQRMFDTIWKSSSKTFQDVMHSVEGTVTQFDILNGSVAYLQFTIGQALEPLVALLIPIIDAIQQWVEENPNLVATGLAILAIGGALLTIGGSAKLALDGLSGFLLKLGLIKTELTALQGLQIAVGIGISLIIIDALVKGGGKLTPQSLADLLIKVGALGMFIFPPVGAALLTIGVGLKLIGDNEFKDRFVLLMGIIFGIVAQLVAALLDLLLLPIRSFINTILPIYNWITGNKIEPISYTATSSSAYNRLTGLIDQYNNYDTGTAQAKMMSAAEGAAYYSQPQGTTNVYNFYGYTGDDVVKAAQSHY